VSAALPRLGQDLVSIARLQAAVERHPEGFRRRVFTPGEWSAAARRADRYAALASRFAAKEAAFKALGTGWGRGAAFTDVEVEGGGRTAPRLALTGTTAALAETQGLSLAVSLSHDGDLALAVVLAWPAGDGTPAK
jgi:holo-[acyl-carrier protein] synthase